MIFSDKVEPKHPIPKIIPILDGQFNKYFESKVKTERIAWKITSQREAAAQAAREIVAKSHTQWQQQPGMGNRTK